MQTRRPLISRVAAGALACAGALFALSAQAQGSYFAIVPVAGSGVVGQLRPVKMALAGATPPAATVGVPYEFNLGALLSLDGPEGTAPDKVNWSIFSGRLPAGLELVGNRVTGVPEEVSAPSVVTIHAEYQNGYQGIGAMQGYAFEVQQPIGLADFEGYRAWADGTFAQSCNEYRAPADRAHSYEGATGDAVYRISPAGIEPFDVRCDMSTDGGGWTLVEYASDLPFANRWTSGNAWRWVPADFKLKLTSQQISALRSVSVTARQRYVGYCAYAVHYSGKGGSGVGGYGNAIGFRFQTGLVSSKGQQVYTPSDISVAQDGCKIRNEWRGDSTIFDIENINLPIVNIMTLDNGYPAIRFGSPLTQYPARFR